MTEEEEEIQKYADEIIHILESDGEMEKIKETIKNMVAKTQWRDDVKKLCNPYMQGDQIDSETAESISEKVQEQALESFPDAIKKAVFKQIEDFLSKKQVT